MSDAVTFTPIASAAACAPPPLQPELAAALLRAQPAIRRAAKDRENLHLHSKYADLASVFDACKDALTAEQILIVQKTVEAPLPTVAIVTILQHVPSGQWLCGEPVRMHAKASDPQSIGSAITYGRKFSLLLAANVVAEDDDGNAGSGRGAEPPERRPPPERKAPPPPPPPTDAEKMATRKAAAVAKLERNLGKEKAAETLAAIVKQNTTNAARLKALEDAAALYKEPAP